MDKMPRRGEDPIWYHTAERQAEFCCTQASAERLQPLIVRRSRPIEL